MTIITESFTTANSDTLGPTLTWTELAGDIDIVSNKAQSVTLDTQVVARANSDLATNDQYVQATVDVSEAAAGASVGLILRKDSSATLTFYLVVASYSSDQVFIIKQIGGSNTTLATVSFALTAGTPIVLRGEVVGDNLRLLVNSVLVATAADTAIATGLRTGIRGNKSTSGSVTWSAFEAGDLGSPSNIKLGRGGPGLHRGGIKLG
jgi:hypothetical protein